MSVKMLILKEWLTSGVHFLVIPNVDGYQIIFLRVSFDKKKDMRG